MTSCTVSRLESEKGDTEERICVKNDVLKKFQDIQKVTQFDTNGLLEHFIRNYSTIVLGSAALCVTEAVASQFRCLQKITHLDNNSLLEEFFELFNSDVKVKLEPADSTVNTPTTSSAITKASRSLSTDISSCTKSPSYTTPSSVHHHLPPCSDLQPPLSNNEDSLTSLQTEASSAKPLMEASPVRLYKTEDFVNSTGQVHSSFIGMESVTSPQVVMETPDFEIHRSDDIADKAVSTDDLRGSPFDVNVSNNGSSTGDELTKSEISSVLSEEGTESAVVKQENENENENANENENENENNNFEVTVETDECPMEELPTDKEIPTLEKHSSQEDHNADMASKMAKNKHTSRKTEGDLKFFTKYLESVGEMRAPEKILPSKLDGLLAGFFQDVRKSDNTEYEPDTLKSFQCSLSRYLTEKGYEANIMASDSFHHSRDVLSAKRKELKAKGKGTKKRSVDILRTKEIEILYKNGQLGTDSPQALINTMWLNNTKHLGIKGREEHRKLKWGDIKLMCTASGEEFLQLTERVPTKKKKYGFVGYRPRVFALPGNSRCPVNAYKEYTRRRPANLNSLPGSAFYLAVSPNVGQTTEWYLDQGLGRNKISKIMKDMIEYVQTVKGNIVEMSAEKNSSVNLPKQSCDLPVESMQAEDVKRSHAESRTCYKTSAVDPVSVLKDNEMLELLYGAGCHKVKKENTVHHRESYGDNMPNIDMTETHERVGDRQQESLPRTSSSTMKCPTLSGPHFGSGVRSRVQMYIDGLSEKGLKRKRVRITEEDSDDD